MRINWTEDEITLLKKLWWDHTPDEVAASFPGRSKKSVTLKACKLKLKRSYEATSRMRARGPRVWNKKEVDLLRKLWWDHTPKEVFAIMNHIPRTSIHTNVRRLGIKRSEATALRVLQERRELVHTRNTTVLGRERNYENAKKAASMYRSRTEFYREDISMYKYIRDNELWDELCSHMAIGNFNYSESFLFECVRQLFPEEEIIRNTRQVIKPYELDIYLPNLRLAFEYNGSHWHNNDEVRERDTIKLKRCNELGIRLYPISEVRKVRQFPESSILESLAALGFDVTLVDVDLCVTNAFNAGYTDRDIREIVSKYTTLKDFRVNEDYLYTLLIRRDLATKYLGGLYRHIADNSPEAVMLALSQVKSANEFRAKHQGKYLAMKKNPEKYKNELIIYEGMRTFGHDRDYTPKSKRTNGKL